MAGVRLESDVRGVCRSFRPRPRPGATALRTIHHTNRQALAELRATVDLRGDGHLDSDPPALAVRPGRPARRRPVQRGGRQSGAQRRPVIVTPLIECTAYRIVQEALTNVLRHATGASARVALDYLPAELVVRIADDGPGGDGHPEGRGILGMRERACSADETLINEPGKRGGFTEWRHA